MLRPQSRFFSSPPTTTNEAAIETSWNGQLYAVIGEQDAQGRWAWMLLDSRGELVQSKDDIPTPEQAAEEAAFAETIRNAVLKTKGLR